MGAVKYTESTPVIEGKLKNPLTVVPLFENDDEKEAEEVIKAVKETLERNPSGDIAILFVQERTLIALLVLYLITKFLIKRLKFSVYHLDR